jgi:hypothetical protein
VAAAAQTAAVAELEEVLVGDAAAAAAAALAVTAAALEDVLEGDGADGAAAVAAAVEHGRVARARAV